MSGPGAGARPVGARPVGARPTGSSAVGPPGGGPSAADRDARYAGYAQAVVRVDLGGSTLVVRPRADGSVAGSFPFPSEPVHVLTAHDPGPTRLAPTENSRRQAALVASLDGYERHPAVAGAEDGSHTEESVLVVGVTDDQARAIGAEWGQDAVFRWTRDAWEIAPCDGGPPVRLGWETRTERR